MLCFEASTPGFEALPLRAELEKNSSESQAPRQAWCPSSWWPARLGVYGV